MSENSLTKVMPKCPAAVAVSAAIVDLCCRSGPAPGTYRDVLQLLQGLVGFDAASIYVVDSGDGLLKETASVGGTVEILRILNSEYGGGLAGWTADSKKPVLLSDRSGHHDFDPTCDYASFISVPLAVAEGVVGVVNLGSKTPGAFCGDDVELLTLVAGQIALAFEKLRLEKLCADLEAQVADLCEKEETAPLEVMAGIGPHELESLVARINHDINNSLAVLIGNIQCIFMEKRIVDQNTLARLRRMERALMKINEANHRLLELVQLTKPREGQDKDGDRRQ